MRKLLAFAWLTGACVGLRAAESPPATTPVAPGVRLLSDVAYLEPVRKEKLDLYLPPDAAGGAPRPAIVYFHGGGWDHGDKATERERNIANHLAGAGYVFISANYILGERSWPLNLQDCKNAVRFARAHAGDYGVDPDRIAAMGTSAGGHLALMAGYTADQAALEPSRPYPGVSSRVRAVIDFYGITDLLTRQRVQEDGTPAGAPYDSHAPEMLGAARTKNPALWRTASPVTHITMNSPPTFIVHGLSDPTVNYGQAIELANALRARGVPHELLLLEGIGHMFHFDRWEDKPMPSNLEPALLAFLAKYLGPLPAAKRN